MTTQSNVLNSFTTDMLAANTAIMEPTSTGIVETTRLAKEGIIANQSNFKALLGQWRPHWTYTMTSTNTANQTLKYVYNDPLTADGVGAMTDRVWGMAAKFFRRVRYDCEYMINVQGMKQVQGALILTYEVAGSCPWATQNRMLNADLGNAFRLPYRILPLMSPSSTLFKCPYVTQIPMRPLSKYPMSDIIKPVGMNIDINFANYVGNRWRLAVLIPPESVAGVDQMPQIRIWMRYTNIDFGIYQPSLGDITP